MNPQGGEVRRVTRHRFGHPRREYFPVGFSEDGERLLDCRIDDLWAGWRPDGDEVPHPDHPRGRG